MQFHKQLPPPKSLSFLSLPVAAQIQYQVSHADPTKVNSVWPSFHVRINHGLINYGLSIHGFLRHLNPDQHFDCGLLTNKTSWLVVYLQTLVCFNYGLALPMTPSFFLDLLLAVTPDQRAKRHICKVRRPLKCFVRPPYYSAGVGQEC